MRRLSIGQPQIRRALPSCARPPIPSSHFASILSDRRQIGLAPTCSAFQYFAVVLCIALLTIVLIGSFLALFLLENLRKAVFISGTITDLWLRE